ncbi:MAG: hypothetical protein LBL62_12105 [Planctomycetaceae bacterium]|nr:hypothetical protein [Planctomycetaceae bacterium]
MQKILFITKHDADDPSFHMCDQFYGFTARPGGGLFVLEKLLSDSSKLVNLLADSVVEKGRMKGRKLQGGAFLSPEERRRIDLWLDANSVFYGTYENTRIQSIGKNTRLALE